MRGRWKERSVPEVADSLSTTSGDANALLSRKSHRPVVAKPVANPSSPCARSLARTSRRR